MSVRAIGVPYRTRTGGSTHYYQKHYSLKNHNANVISDIIIRITLIVLATIFIASSTTDIPTHSPVNMAKKLDNAIVNRITNEVIYPQVVARPLASPQISVDEVDDILEPILPPEEITSETVLEPILPPEETVIEVEPEPILPELTPMELMNAGLGNDTIDIGIGNLTRYDLPDKFYTDIDYSSFQPWMSYKVIKDKTSAAWKVVSDPRMYIDENGMCRFEVDPEAQFTIDGQDDFVIALGTYYKPKGTCGDRWLVVTTTGMYTAITGDEKADEHTDEYNMFSSHDGYAGVIEWLVDTPSLEYNSKVMGSCTYAPVEALHGDILYMYRID